MVHLQRSRRRKVTFPTKNQMNNYELDLPQTALGKTARKQIDSNAIGLKYDTDGIYQPKAELYLQLLQLVL